MMVALASNNNWTTVALKGGWNVGSMFEEQSVGIIDVQMLSLMATVTSPSWGPPFVVSRHA